MTLKVMIHVQHLMGIGHLRRTAVLARALATDGMRVVMVSGGMPVSALDVGGANFVQLPPTRARDLTYKTLVDEHGDVVDDHWRQRRAAALMNVVQAFAPDVVVTETFPFGRRLLRFELEPLLEWCANARPRVALVASIRDILEAFPGPTGRMEAVIERVQDYYDLVLIHGDERFVELADTFPAAAQIKEYLCYTGYISGAANDDDVVECADEVLVSTGGGVVGRELARTAIAAARLPDAPPCRWRILLGHNLGETQFDELVQAAGANTVVERNRADFVARLRGAKASISQAGYNTMAELLATATPAVVVPFVADGQYEQTRRAELLAGRGRVQLLMPDELTDIRLAEALQRALASRPDGTAEADLSGAAAAAAAIRAHFAPDARQPDALAQDLRSDELAGSNADLDADSRR